jgi:hypothetical protein
MVNSPLPLITGWARFDHVHSPRTNLLGGIAAVDKDGRYSRIPGGDKRMFVWPHPDSHPHPRGRQAHVRVASPRPSPSPPEATSACSCGLTQTLTLTPGGDKRMFVWPHPDSHPHPRGRQAHVRRSLRPAFSNTLELFGLEPFCSPAP